MGKEVLSLYDIELLDRGGDTLARCRVGAWVSSWSSLDVEVSPGCSAGLSQHLHGELVSRDVSGLSTEKGTIVAISFCGSTGI